MVRFLSYISNTEPTEKDRYYVWIMPLKGIAGKLQHVRREKGDRRREFIHSYYLLSTTIVNKDDH